MYIRQASQSSLSYFMKGNCSWQRDVHALSSVISDLILAPFDRRTTVKIHMPLKPSYLSLRPTWKSIPKHGGPSHTLRLVYWKNTILEARRLISPFSVPLHPIKIFSFYSIKCLCKHELILEYLQNKMKIGRDYRHGPWSRPWSVA